MAFLRVCAWLFLLSAVVLVTNDVTQAVNGRGPMLTTTLSHWKAMYPGSLTATMTFVQKSLSPKLWDQVFLRLLLLPLWGLAGALGLMCALLGRRKRRVNIFAN